MSEKSLLADRECSRNVRTSLVAQPLEQLYAATNLEHLLLPANYPASIWIAQQSSAPAHARQRRLFHRFTLEVWAWIWQQLAKANDLCWEKRDRGEPCVDLEEQLRLAATRLEPLHNWANTHFYPPGTTNALAGVMPRLPRTPASQEILERMDDAWEPTNKSGHKQSHMASTACGSARRI